jgi:hypothetical protein
MQPESDIRWEEIDDTKAVIIIRISKKNIQHNGQKKRYKRTNNDLQNIHIKLKIENNLCETKLVSRFMVIYYLKCGIAVRLWQYNAVVA